MANAYTKKCSRHSSPGKRKSKPQCHRLPSFGVAVIKNTEDKCWRRCGETGTPARCRRGRDSAELLEDGTAFPQVITNRAPAWPGSPASGRLSRRTEARISKRRLRPVFTAVLITTAETWEQPGCPPGGQIGKLRHIPQCDGRQPSRVTARTPREQEAEWAGG